MQLSKYECEDEQVGFTQKSIELSNEEFINITDYLGSTGTSPAKVGNSCYSEDGDNEREINFEIEMYLDVKRSTDTRRVLELFDGYCYKQEKEFSLWSTNDLSEIFNFLNQHFN